MQNEKRQDIEKPLYLQIAVHRRLDGDEALVTWMVRMFKKRAEKFLPGSSTAKLICFTEDILPSGYNENDMSHILFVGCGKGRFDEHTEGDPEKCAATKVAHALGVRNWKSLQRLLRVTLEEDRDKAKVRSSFGDAVKVISHLWIEDPEKTYEWAAVAYNAIYAYDLALTKAGQELSDRQLSIYNVRDLVEKNLDGRTALRWMKVYKDAVIWREGKKREAREIWDNTQLDNYVLPDGRIITLGIVHSDNPQINFVGWNERKVCILVQVNEPRNNEEGNNVQIYTRQDLRLCLREVAFLARHRELELEGVTTFPRPSVLRGVGTVRKVPVWHLYDAKNENKPILFNGNQITSPNVSPTKIPLKELVSFVIRGLDLKKEGDTRRPVEGSVGGKRAAKG